MEKNQEKVEEVKETDEQMFVKMQKAAERLEAANKQFELNRMKEEAARAERTLAGQGEAGIEPPKKPEETPEAYAQRIMAGDKP